MKTCDIVLIGVGGQGVVTLGDLMARAAMAAGVPLSYVPTKGMAQRGGFVKVEIRLGREHVGPRVSKHSADIVVSMELSEALKGRDYVCPDGRFILYDHVWEPTGVLLGEDEYPTQEAVLAALSQSARDVLVLNPVDRPTFDGKQVAANIYAFGALAGASQLKGVLDSRRLEQTVVERWPRMAEANLAAFQAGFVAGNQPIGQFLGDSRTRHVPNEGDE